MVYEADLDKLPMSVFIEIYTNPDNDISFNIDKKEAVMMLVERYMDIIGGTDVSSYLARENELLNFSTMIEALEGCKNLIKLGMFSEVSEVLNNYGYNIPAEDHEKMSQRINTLQSKVKYDLDKALKYREEFKKENKATTRESFTQERVFLMRFNKLHIEVDKITASEYAYLVKQTAEEIKNIKQQKHGKIGEW
jgi:hypothetical protein